MTREWGLVVLSCAIMVLAGSIVFSAVLKAPFNVGSIGQWASAIATVTAVWVALRNTAVTLARTEERDREKARAADKVLFHSLVSLSEQMLAATRHLDKALGAKPMTPAQAKRWIRITGVEGLMKTLDRLPVHQFPHGVYVDAFRNIRTVGTSLETTFQEIIDGVAPASPNVKKELKLAKDTHVVLKNAAASMK